MLNGLIWFLVLRHRKCPRKNTTLSWIVPVLVAPECGSHVFSCALVKVGGGDDKRIHERGKRKRAFTKESPTADSTLRYHFNSTYVFRILKQQLVE